MSKPASPPIAGLRFSIVTAVYDVERWLDAFTDSIDAQQLSADRFEVIVVDDGSTDGSLAKLEDWAARRPGLVRVLTKENGGQASARNLGLEHARGEWVTFTDPDDVLPPDYLQNVDRFLVANPRTVLAGTARLLLNDATGELTKHPLHRHFQGGDRVRDLSRHGDYFYASAPCAFFRRQLLEEHGLRFDPGIRPHFEDGYFTCDYLLRAERPFVGFVGSAEYHYRKRGDQSSTLRRSLADPGRYTTVMERGYLAILRQAVELTGGTPEWLQQLVVYDISWYLSSQDAAAGAFGAQRGAVAEEFHRLLGEILRLIDPAVIEGFRLRPLKRHWREILLHAYDPRPWRSPFALLQRQDSDQQLVKIVYDFTGDQPEETFTSNGKEVEPVHSKVRDISYHHRVLLHERIVWLPVSDLRIKVDGRPIELRYHAPEPPAHLLRGAAIRRNLTPSALDVGSLVRGRSASEPVIGSAFGNRLLALLAGSAPVRRYFRDAWVLMDRIHDANDSAEHLFHHLRARRPDISAWFVVEKGTPDWHRIRAQHPHRLVAHGSLRWKLLLANCRHLISSHADKPVMRPDEVTAFHRPSWRFTFLQHGVIKDDLSQWLNPKDLDLFITSTKAEWSSIAGDASPYAYTGKEAKLTGLPRFDRLRQKAEEFPPERRDLLLVAPTWREWLVPPLAAGSQRRTLVLSDFLASDYAVNWLAFLGSAELAEAARASQLQIGFLPHPNIQPILAQLELPDHVLPLTYDGDVQELFARAAAFVTDYSSIAFNAAYLDRPVVYFQFDHARIVDGGHVGRQGYFEYERDGFGPVVQTAGDAVAAVRAVLDDGARVPARFAARVQEAFPLRDGRCSERVVAAIEESTRPAVRQKQKQKPPVPEPAADRGSITVARRRAGRATRRGARIARSFAGRLDRR